MEEAAGFEPANKGFAGPRLTGLGYASETAIKNPKSII